MPLESSNGTPRLKGHALRNVHLRERSLARAATAPLLARSLVEIRARVLGLTRLEFSRQSGISRGTLRDIELGIHTPTRRILQRFVAFCQKRKVDSEQLEELRRLYAGPSDTLARMLARLELRAGSPFELAKRVGISHATLWEYRRGNFPLPLAILRRMCQAVGEESAPAESLWRDAERRRLLERGYPESLAEFWVLCARQGYAERHLLTRGLNNRAARRLRYLELPAWSEMAKVAAAVCQDQHELESLRNLWHGDLDNQRNGDTFGPRLKQARLKQGVSRRELADLFGIGGKKPARIIKHIEEDGFYSAQAYPAGLVALLAPEIGQAGLLDLWRKRRAQFHRRHRPETRIDLRLARELYGFGPADMEKILGYPNLEYQRIERGVAALADTGRERIIQAIHQAGRGRVEELLRRRQTRAADELAWQAPTSVKHMLTALARREGGLVPLARHLRKAGVKALWPGACRDIAKGKTVPPWPVLEQIARACAVADLDEVRQDWSERYRERLRKRSPSPLGIEVRLLIAEVATTARAFSRRLPFSSSVLVRDLQRMDRDDPVRWACVERVLVAAGVRAEGERWREFRALWATTGLRKRKPAVPRGRIEVEHGTDRV